jgi:hypothetical protein
VADCNFDGLPSHLRRGWVVLAACGHASSGELVTLSNRIRQVPVSLASVLNAFHINSAAAACHINQRGCGLHLVY